MSALSEYIHLNTFNYLKYGTARIGESKQLLEDSYERQKQVHQNLLKQIQIEDIDKSALEELRIRVANEAKAKEAWEYAKEKANASTKEKTTSEQAAASLTKAIQKKYSTVKDDSEEKGSFVSVIKKSFNQENLNLNEEGVEIQKAKTARNTLYKSISEMNKKLATPNYHFRKDINKQIQTIKDNFDDFFRKIGVTAKTGNLSDYFKITNDMSTLVALHNFVKSIQYNNLEKAIKGNFGEIIVKKADDVITSLSWETVKKTMLEPFEGEHESNISLTTDQIPQFVADYIQQEDGYNVYKVFSTKDKVDVAITVKDVELLTNVKAYESNGKYYTPHLQDVNLLESLATTELQFGNHWLNLHTGSRRNKDLISDTDRNLMDEELKWHIAYEALVHGNLTKKDVLLANTFVSIDTNTGQVYVSSTADMLQNKLDNFHFGPDISKLMFKNEYVPVTEGATQEDAIKQRLAKILAIVRKKKIYVTYKVMVE